MTCDYCHTTLTDHIVKHGEYLACEACEASEDLDDGPASL